MIFVIGLFTFVLLLDCVALILLVLMQLPKKDAGAGVAFGGAATDALFGAGSGNFLTKATKYATIILFVLALGLSIMETRYYNRPGSAFRRQLQEQQNRPLTTSPNAVPAVPNTAEPAQTPATAETSAPAAIPGTNFQLTLPPAETGTPSNATPAQQK